MSPNLRHGIVAASFAAVLLAVAGGTIYRIADAHEKATAARAAAKAAQDAADRETAKIMEAAGKIAEASEPKPAEPTYTPEERARRDRDAAELKRLEADDKAALTQTRR